MHLIVFMQWYLILTQHVEHSGAMTKVAVRMICQQSKPTAIC